MKRELKPVLILLGLAYFFFMPGNGILSLTNPDEVFYAQTAKEMSRQHSWLVPYLFDRPQFEKPVLLYWLLRVAFSVFGPSSFSARFFPALFAAIGVIAVYFLGLAGFKERKKALLCALVLASSGLYIGLAHTVFTDLIFSVFILLSLLSFFRAYTRVGAPSAEILLAFIFSALAVLTKGPLGFMIPASVIIFFLFLRKDFKFLSRGIFFWGLLIFVAISFPWYVFMIKKFGAGFIHEFFYNDHLRRIIEAEHAANDTWYFYPLSMFGCMFPWSAYVGASFWYLFRQRLRSGAPPFYLFLACWISVVFWIFQIAHSKLASYIFPLFPALALAAGDFIYENVSSPWKQGRLFFAASAISAGAFILLPAGLLIALARYPSYISSKASAYGFIFAFAVFTLTILYFVFSRKFIRAIYLCVFLLPLVLLLPVLFNKEIDPHLSSRDACSYLLKNYKVDNAILCSKFFVRGVRYYTDKEVAVIAPYDAGFFSPHPIAMLDTDQKVKDFLRKQSLTFCILKKSSLEDIGRTVQGGEVKLTILKEIGNAYLVQAEFNQPPSR